MNTNKNELIKSSLTRLKCNANAQAIEILETWKMCLNQCISKYREHFELYGIGIAMPGPFDYERGISLIKNVGKFDSLFGINIRQYFSSEFKIDPLKVIFLNDAACFALGEYFYGALKSEHEIHKKCLFLTIGSGFGSTFLSDGKVVSDGDTVPDYGWLYHVAFKEARAEDYFCDKWIIKRYELLMLGSERKQFAGVNDIPDDSLKGEFYKIIIFEDYAFERE